MNFSRHDALAILNVTLLVLLAVNTWLNFSARNFLALTIFAVLLAAINASRIGSFAEQKAFVEKVWLIVLMAYIVSQIAR
jgi:hypothetical protein